MQTFVSVLLFTVGLFFTVKGGDSFVSAATRISARFGIPQFVIGATVVSIATTLPEIIVSLLSAADGKTAMAVGNAVGSVTANTGLIMALSIFFLPQPCKGKSDRLRCLIMLLMCACLLAFSRSGSFGALGGVCLFFLLTIFIFDSVRLAKSESSHKSDQNGKLFHDIFGFTIGAAGIIIGARLLVDNATILARSIGVSEALISVTVIAIGTSLPELVTTLTAIKKRQASLSLGNIIGANIIDTAVILPSCAILSGKELPISAQSLYYDIPVCFFITAIAVIPTLISRKFLKIQGILMLLIYIAYIIFICIKGV